MNAAAHAPFADLPDFLMEEWRPTQLIELPQLARLAKVGRVLAKSEGERPFGNFKVLGGMVAGLRALARAAEAAGSESSKRPRLLCASDGNHGLAVAAAAARGGAKASVYLPMGISHERARRIESAGAELMWVRGTYDDAVHEAAAAAARGEGMLISDTSPDPHDQAVQDVLSGYAVMTRELVSQLRDDAKARPTHVFVQAGVGGLAAAVAEGLRDSLSAPGRILVVEPESAACVAHALAAGEPVRIDGNLRTSAEMLSGGLACAAALEILKRHKARSVVVSEEDLHAALRTLRAAGGPDTTVSGAAGISGLLHVAARPAFRHTHQLDENSVVLVVITEGPVPAHA